MLRTALFFNFFQLILYSVVLLIRSIKKSDSTKLLVFSILSCVLSICNFAAMTILDFGLEFLFYTIGFLAAMVIYVVSIILCIVKRKRKTKKASRVASTILLLIPTFTLLIPLVYDQSLLNRCTYLLEYNYQNGIIISEYTRYAIIDNKFYQAYSMKNLLPRECTEYQWIQFDQLPTYQIGFGNSPEFKIEGDETYMDEIQKIGKLVAVMPEHFSTADVIYFPAAKSALVLTSTEVTPKKYGAYFYNGTEMKNMPEKETPDTIYCYGN